MKASDTKLSDGHSPEHDALVFEAEAYFRKIFKVVKVSYEVPIADRGSSYIVGYVDLCVEVEVIYEDEYSLRCYAVEVKPKIDSFGALLRQLNTYKHNVRRLGSDQVRGEVVFCVYTHDQKYAPQIESQGYVCYPKPIKKKSKTK